MRKSIRRCVLVCGISLGMGTCASALAAGGLDLGKREYDASCATCHGLDGKGRGSFSEALQLTVPDLTTLKRRNAGVFPAGRVYETIDGTAQVKAHGTREMPIWGRHFAAAAAPVLDDFPYDPSAAARGRILMVIDYLYRLQAP